MLEIPESQTVSRQLDETVSGKMIKDVAAASSPHGFAWYLGEPSEYPKLLRGRKIGGAQAVAGYIKLTAEDATVLLHDGTNARYYGPGAKLPDKHQLYIGLDDGSSIVCTVQMYGGMYAFTGETFDSPYYNAAREKPSPLAGEFDAAYFDRLRRDTPAKLSVKALLATEQRIPGLGNGCLQDILFDAKINPQTKLAALSDDDFERLFRSVKTVLAAMTEQGGRDVEKDLFGNPGGYKTILSSKTAAYACPECGGGITRKAYMGGNVYFCPSCQLL